MTRIDFYQIDSDEAPLGFACRLIEKIYRQRYHVHVHADGLDQAAELDDLLWTFRPDRFIPHCLVSTGVQAPVTIAHDHEPDNDQQVLVNLSGEVPHFFSRFERVAEVVPRDAGSRQSARANYKFYRDRGYPLHYHQMKAGHG